MPTATRVFIPPTSLFGDLEAPEWAWSIDQHTESLPFGDYIVRIQTSSAQTDDGTRGTWHFMLWSTKPGRAVVAQTQVPWDGMRHFVDPDRPEGWGAELDDVRELAIEWAHEQLDAAGEGRETAREPVSARAAEVES